MYGLYHHIFIHTGFKIRRWRSSVWYHHCLLDSKTEHMPYPSHTCTHWYIQIVYDTIHHCCQCKTSVVIYKWSYVKGLVHLHWPYLDAMIEWFNYWKNQLLQPNSDQISYFPSQIFIFMKFHCPNVAFKRKRKETSCHTVN